MKQFIKKVNIVNIITACILTSTLGIYIHLTAANLKSGSQIRNQNQRTERAHKNINQKQKSKTRTDRRQSMKQKNYRKNNWNRRYGDQRYWNRDRWGWRSRYWPGGYYGGAWWPAGTLCWDDYYGGWIDCSLYSYPYYGPGFGFSIYL